MPATFTHPLAVVPLRRFCPARLNFAGLIIGSMSPDFGYYLRQFDWARFAHTVLGTLTVCLPSGLAVLGLFYLLRRPLCFILPQPHRACLMPLVERRPALSFTWFLSAAISVLLGAWTHTVWDSFTHDGAWSVEHIPILQATAFQVGDTVLPVSYVLQQTSTFAGGALLAFLYFRWLQRQRKTITIEKGALPDSWRYTLIAILVAVSIAVAIPMALRLAFEFQGYTAFRVFIFRAAVYSAALFIPLLVIS
jgi:hypothetical protein